MSDSTVTFYTNPRSRGGIVRWMLEETGIPYDTTVVQYGQEMKADAYRAINPMGKVPALVHGSTVVTETAAIIAYLADAFPDAGLAPAPADRGAYYRWMFFTAGPLEAAITDKALAATPSAEQQGFVGYGTFDLAVSTVADHLAGRRYVVGDRFTAGDVYLGAMIGYGLQAGSLPDRPEFRAYHEGLTKRPAYAQARKLDDALLAAQS